MYPYRAVHTLSTILRKAEGSRGGHIIGHTKSGKPIYEAGHTANAKISSIKTAPSGHDNNNQTEQRLSATIGSHGNYSAQDHRDAANAHSKSSKKAGDIHDRLAAGHEYASGFLSHRPKGSSQRPAHN